MRLVKRFLKWLGILTGLALFFFFVGAALVNWVIMPRVVRLGREVEVPDVGGKSLAEAVRILEEHNLKLFVESREFDPLVPEEYVSSQTPLAGQIVKEGRKISLVVSLGPERVTIPHLRDLTVERARSLLERSGLVVGDISITYSDSVLPGMVISSIPPFDSLVDRRTKVGLIVSRTAEPMEMPNLIGEQLGPVEARLNELGLVLADVEQVKGEDVEEGTVLLQFPQPGTEVSEGDTVKLVVSER